VDVQKPSVSITNPTTGKIYTNAQTVTVFATSSDNAGVAKVEIYEGASARITNTSSPYTFNWPFTVADNGPHVWTARAYDAAGNVATSTPITLTVSN